MALTYDEIIDAARQLPDEEQRRLRDELNTGSPADQPSGAAFAAFLKTAPPIRPEALDRMEQAIAELDVINPHDWE